MKILYLHQYFKFPSENGGTRSYDLATGFAEKGYEIEIVTSTSDPEYNQAKRWVKLQKDGLIVHYIYLPYGNHLSYFKRSLVFFQFLWFASSLSFFAALSKLEMKFCLISYSKSGILADIALFR